MLKSVNILSVLAIILATAALLALQLQPASAQRNGPYQLVAHSNDSANVGIFRININTGGVSFCSISGLPEVVRCSPEAE